MLKSILIALSVLLLSAVTLSQPAQAGPILTQEFLAEDAGGEIISIGAISFDTDDLDEWFPGTGDLLAWESFTLFGFEIDTSLFFVSVGFNPEDLYAGLEFISFDVTDVGMTMAFQGFFDLNDQSLPPQFTMFNFISGELTVSDIFSPGQVSVVSAPATIWLLFASAGGLLLRQRRQNMV
ncbi:PEP-CTERM sorting domain-containing protein [Rheinheimera sp. NSM]|uniref:PEP-CTERM sorting domain-containing protein n=1 Tax=Rheinheimera sp. NSM TaxID=3457884 RepID=UPI0040352C01